MIECIRNQPIDFCDRLECFDEAFCIRQIVTDISKVQVGLSEKTGTQLVTNGNFSAGTDWTLGTGWAITGGFAVATAATGNLVQPTIFTVGNYYKIQFTLSEIIAGVIDTPIGSTNINGTYQGVFLATNTDLIFDPTTFTGKIDNVSAYELSMVGWNIIDCETGETIIYNGDGAVGVTYLETDINAAAPFSGETDTGRAMLTFDWDVAPLDDIVKPSCFCICLVIESDVNECTLQSQPICLATTHPGTVLFAADQDQGKNFDLGGGEYINYVNFSFEMNFRCEALRWHPHWEEEYDNFQLSDFERQTVKFSSVEVLELTTEELPVSQHRALAAMVGHDNFTIDVVRYHKFGSGISPEWQRGTDHASFIIEVVEDSKGLKNSNC